MTAAWESSLRLISLYSVSTQAELCNVGSESISQFSSPRYWLLSSFKYFPLCLSLLIFFDFFLISTCPASQTVIQSLSQTLLPKMKRYMRNRQESAGGELGREFSAAEKVRSSYEWWLCIFFPTDVHMSLCSRFLFNDFSLNSSAIFSSLLLPYQYILICQSVYLPGVHIWGIRREWFYRGL